jgi:hypothetical protein
MEKIEIDKAIIEIRTHLKFLDDLHKKLEGSKNFPDAIKVDIFSNILSVYDYLIDTVETLQLIQEDDWQGWEDREKRASDDEIYANAKIKMLSSQIFLDAGRIQKLLDLYPKDKIENMRQFNESYITMKRIEELAQMFSCDPVGFSRQYK